MIPRLTDRLTRLEAETATPPAGKYLTFQFDAPPGTPKEDVVAFLRRRGHVFREEDTVLLMHLGTGPLRDLTPDIVTEEVRAAASPAVAWPTGAPTAFTFELDSPKGPPCRHA